MYQDGDYVSLSWPIQSDHLSNCRFGEGTFSWQDPVHSWKAGPGEVMTVENNNSTSRELLGLEAAKGRLRGRIDSEKSVAISLQPARLICNVNRLQSKPLFGWATKSLSYKANL